MNAKHFFMAALIAALGLTACSNDDDPVNGSDDLVRINSAVGQPTPVLRATFDYTGAGSFDNGDTWGLYAYTGSNALLSNSVYTVGSTNLYWSDLSVTEPVTFSAYYPRFSSVSDPEAFFHNVANAAYPDLLVAVPVTESKSSGNGVDLIFNHVMHRLSLSLTLGDLPGTLAGATISLLNTKPSAKINLLTGEVDATAAGGVGTYPEKDITDLIFIVAPQDLTPGTDWIKIELADGNAYVYKVPADLTNGADALHPTRLKSGQWIKLMLTLKKGGSVELTQAISGWIDQHVGTINGDAVES